MKINLPKKSLFGFRVLNSRESLYSAYFLLLFTYILYPKFGYQEVEKIASYIFFIISNFSFLILLLNSVLRMPKNKKILNISNIPLFLHLPISIYIILISIKKLLILILI